MLDRYISFELNQHNNVSIFYNYLENDRKQWYEKKVLYVLIDKKIPDYVKKKVIDEGLTEYLIFVNFHIAAVNKGLPKAIKRNRDFFNLFNYVIWNNSWEGPLKFQKTNLPSDNSLPIFDYCKNLMNIIGRDNFVYIDSDMDIERQYNLWKKDNPDCNIKIAFAGDIWSSVLHSAIKKDFNNTEYNLKSQWIPYRKDVKFNFDGKIYWCYNRIFRLGKLYTVYNLWKEDLLKFGHVSYYGNSGLDPSMADYISQQFQYHELIDDRRSLYKFCRLSNFQSDKVDHNNNLASTLNYNLLSCPINICTETNFFEDNLFFNEKSIKPILFGQLILPAASAGVFQKLSELFGFKFSDVTLDVDAIKDNRKRVERIIDYIKIFSTDKKKLILETEKNFLNFEHNIDIIEKNSSLYTFKNSIAQSIKLLKD